MSNKNLHVIIGLGITGLSCARHLAAQNIPIAVVDTRLNPPQLNEFKKHFPDIPLVLGSLDTSLLTKADVIVMSPGISLQEAVIQRQIEHGTPVIGDIELFARAVNVPIIAITGTNAKSTVTTLVGEMAAASGIKAQVGGNLGIPALDLLGDASTELFVLEVSSFQLEATFSLKSKVGTILNITPDHMDRYANLADYIAAKQRIYESCETAVVNRDDPLTYVKSISNAPPYMRYFTLNIPGENEFGLIQKANKYYLAFEDRLLLPVSDLRMVGRHSQANSLAALAIGYAYGLSMDSMLHTLREFNGLPHRCQFVRERHHVRWYNDSKGTNVGAALAAIEGLGSDMQFSEMPGEKNEKKLLLIAGGVGKHADFSSLVAPIKKYVKMAILIGESAPVLADLLKHHTVVQLASSMQEAVQLADEASTSGDSVLLSPACASFDMFNNFEHRGQIFSEILLNL